MNKPIRLSLLFLVTATACSTAEHEGVPDRAWNASDNGSADNYTSFPSQPTGNPAGSGGTSGSIQPVPAPNEGDRFEAVGTNPFVMTQFDPFSTFAADVDTASYDIFRRDIERDVRPVPASVRVEEYLNYFTYNYPPPAADAAHPFAISLAATTHVYNRNTALVRVGIQGKLSSPQQKKPTNLVFLVDTSGSMQSNDKLPLVQSVLRQSLDVLNPEDTVSMVTYAGSSGLKLAPTPAANRDKILKTIDGLFASGSTNGAGGIQMAYEQAQIGFIPGGINHVVLMTDGDFNVGTSSTEALVSLIEEKRKTGVTLTVIGFGIGNLNDEMMEKVSNAGNGIYSLISSSEGAHRYVHERLLSTLEHIAKDVKIQVEWNPSIVTAYRLIGYENRAIADQDFRNDVVDAGEIGSGHRVTALYEIVLAGQPVPSPPGSPTAKTGAPSALASEVKDTDIVMVKLRYKQPGAKEADPAAEMRSVLPFGAILASVDLADPDLRWAVGIAAFAEILKGSPFADPTALDAIANIVKEQAARDPDRSEFAALFARTRTLLGK